MHVTCTNEAIASRVQVVLRRHGITVISQQGPFLNDKGEPTVYVLVNQAVSSDKEPLIRREISRIPGATISD